MQISSLFTKSPLNPVKLIGIPPFTNPISFQGTSTADSVKIGNLPPVLRLAQTRAYYMHAAKHKYAIPAFNINNMEQAQGIFAAASKAKSPLIAQASEGAVEYARVKYIVALANVGKEEDKKTPIMLHLDHGHTFEACKEFIKAGGDSVMIDGSDKSYDENVKLTRKVVEYAHKRGVFVEAEIGELTGDEDTHKGAEYTHFTEPEDAKRFVRDTGCDSLAISIGTSHGPNKAPEGVELKLDFDRITKIKKAIASLADEIPNLTKEQKDYYRNFPLVLHGASSAPKDLIEDANANIVVASTWDKVNKIIEGKADPSIITEDEKKAMEKYSKRITGNGVPEADYKTAVKLGIRKLNVDTDFRLAVFAAIKRYMEKKPTEIDPRKYFGEAREAITKISIRKMEMLNSSGKARGAKIAGTRAVHRTQAAEKAAAEAKKSA